ncbi:dihydrolipoyl dehydrogenase family protein [Desulfotignum phosphitoxidans]|uniref:Mercuric reductase MerA n=1 Tax=Desulfotignum phosphitoxidans DSM 13687 TaxID=1286635 RepID=S0G890_9BACT|nr:FAD-dependent oxidoreductase [Desulfotignum phosphitoxidans]EMS81621.1 mercuric reductase MerA [Desulfotignum phosphitoxidans DSM 13687]
MNTYEFDIGIIGGGAAGLTIASGAAQLGAKVILIEQEDRLGGDCLHYGCVPSKTLIKSARVYHQIKHASAFGLPEMEIPPVDFRQIADRIRSVVDTIQKHDSEERFCSLGAKVVFGQPRFVDEHAVQVNGTPISAAKWVIATGSSPAVPPIQGLADTPHLTNREIFYMDTLPGSMIMLGAGPIGIEMAQAFNRLGTRVTVINRSPRILGKEDKDMADAVMQIMGNEGVQFVLDASIEQVEHVHGQDRVTITDSTGNRQQITADALLVAMGRSPNTDGLGLADIDIPVEQAGIPVDNRLRTRHKHIYAAGDVTGGFQFTHAAGYEGGIVIANAVFRLPRKINYTWLPWVTYTDPELAGIGMNETMAKKAGIKYAVITEAFKDNDRSLAEGESQGKIKLLLDEKEKPIGVQILGPGAGNLISEWVAAFNGNVKLSTLAGAIHPYPTLGEINKRVAGTFLSPKIFSPTIQKGLKFFFNLKGRACHLTD